MFLTEIIPVCTAR
ncbi:Protein of unknown function [Lactobacillus acidophilus DSM 9126]|nr:Protein of unknown function [Lactobacillus acidophilus DSM 20079 = JCM 1132 = NBRC 13951 = CIP 76.13]CDF69850.1 Protein of unknown function [Lactobacillus acidophilus CIRM-BIA 442]CDF71646.1 Protein of unknown function [Lactobacillus acidophilus CIRM-BIA 445]CDF73471.1 Protein of unknown function [Lactobacillus acidophilus DSM 9126]CDF75465.1 Protein of unknown function [Lactobacillus acidophilus DSM 20242]